MKLSAWKTAISPFTLRVDIKEFSVYILNARAARGLWARFTIGGPKFKTSKI